MSHPTNRLTDSAGQPWQGRSFRANDRSGDDGSAPPALVETIAALRKGEGSEGAVVSILRDSRVLIPLVSHAGTEGTTAEGLRVDKTQELSIVTVEGPDGRTVMPIFSSVGAMQRWDSVARPIPVEMRRAALAAADEQTDVAVLDPTSDSEFVVRRPALWAIAQGKGWAPAYEDVDVRQAFEVSVASETFVQGVDVLAGDPSALMRGPEVTVRLRLAPGLTAEALNELATRVSQRWATSELIAERVDSVKIALARGETPSQREEESAD